MTPWDRAMTALRLLALDPDGLGGIALHARSGPVRDAFLAHLPSDTARLHPALPLEALTGGIDVAASLGSGTLMRQRGLLEGPARQMILAMAERTPPLMAHGLCAWLDGRGGNSLIALDERTDDDPAPPAALWERLAFHVTLEGLGLRDVVDALSPGQPPLPPAAIGLPDSAIDDIVTLCAALGVHSLRAPLLALNAARAHAALRGSETVSDKDIQVAAELVLAPRATHLPQMPEEPPESPPEPDRGSEDDSHKTPDPATLTDDLLIAAIQTALPAGLLAKSGSDKGKTAKGSGAGERRVGNRRGRPLPARDGGARGGNARVDLVATLRAAVPWQSMRRAAQPDRTGPIIHPRDLRFKRFEDLSDRLLIFAVDASGSAALARLAEAKGAVEFLLSEAYARRDHVALIAFRGQGAEVLLPPTRSLVQTKRRLADLPGGGGTPLAAGLQAGLETAFTARRKGLSPCLIVLTDGRSNVALDGSADRTQAAEDATRLAVQIAQAGVDSIVIDTGRRPEPGLERLALSLRGRYLSLPRADARSLSHAIDRAVQE